MANNYYRRGGNNRSGGRNVKFLYNRNNYIKAESVRVIDEEGSNLGEMKTPEAIGLARDKNLDLVEVSPNAKPPVTRIMEWSKFLYEQKKKQKQAKKNKQKDLKELRFGISIAQGDKDRRLKRAKEFLDDGHNVKITVVKKGRVSNDQAKTLLNDLLTALSEYSTIDNKPSYEGRRISMTVKTGKNG